MSERPSDQQHADKPSVSDTPRMDATLGKGNDWVFAEGCRLERELAGVWRRYESCCERALSARSAGTRITGAELALRIYRDAEFLKFVAMNKSQSAAMQAALIAQSASERTDPFAEMMKRRNADADICFPGNHGGPDNKWLVTLTMQDANVIEEYFGDTLSEALEKATMGPADRRATNNPETS